MDDRYFTPPIPNGWFQIAYADELAPGRVLPLRYFGKSLTATRLAAGSLEVVDHDDRPATEFRRHHRQLDVLGDALGLVDRVAVLRDRTDDAQVVHLLERAAAQVLEGALAAEDEDRRVRAPGLEGEANCR